VQRSRKARVTALPSGRQAFLESPHHLFDGDFLFYTLFIILLDNDLEVVMLYLF
jgi:hypothetical protein